MDFLFQLFCQDMTRTLHVVSEVPPVSASMRVQPRSGRATREPHVAIVPLADVGWNYSQGRLMGLALVWPRDVADAERRMALQVIVAFLSRART